MYTKVIYICNATDYTLTTELTIDHDGFKKLMLDQTNTAKIRPILLSFNGLVESNEKTKALNHLLGHYVDESPLNPMTKKCGNKLESEGITYYELVAAGFSLRNISVAEVSKESSCAFGILSAFKQKLLSDHEAPRFVPVDDPQQGVPSRKIFEDPSLDEHFREVHKYLSKDKHLSKGNLSMILQVLPEGIALVNVWDININEKVQHVLQALKGHLFNMHIWLVLDVLKDKEQSKNPPEVQSGTSDLTKSRSPLDYQLRSGRMCESHKEERKGAITIFGNYSGHQSEQQLKQNIANLEMEIMQRAKHIGIASLVEPAIHPINLNTNDSSFHLYWKFLQLVYDKPYVDVPVSWIFLRSLFYRSTKQFIAKSDLLAKAKECGMSEASLNEFCVFYTSFGSIFDLTLVDPNYKYVIVKPIGFLKSLNTILSPADEMCRKYPSLQYGIISGNVLKELFHENWQVFIDALVSLRLATQVDNESLEISPANSKASYYFVPLSRSSADRRNASVVATQIVDSTAVNLVTTIDTPHVCKQAFIAKYLLESLPNSKLVNCNDKITVAVRDVSTGATVTMVSSNPITQFIITQPSPRICRLIVEAMKKIANLYKEGTVKYKYIVFCAKTRRHQLDVLSVLSTSQYHILPNDDLCKECQKVGKVDKQLLAWNDALRIVREGVGEIFLSLSLFLSSFSVLFPVNLVLIKVDISLFNFPITFFPQE